MNGGARPAGMHDGGIVPAQDGMQIAPPVNCDDGAGVIVLTLVEGKRFGKRAKVVIIGDNAVEVAGLVSD